MSVQVDQVTGVGTLIQTGDHVDVIVGFGGSTAVALRSWVPGDPAGQRRGGHGSR